MAQYSNASMYADTQQKSGFLSHYVNIPVVSSPTDYDFEVLPIYNNRPDRLAYDLYGSPGLWWVIPRLNQFSDLVFDLKEGMTIKVMTAERMMQYR